MLELLRGIRRFVSSYAFNLPAHFFIERVSAAREVSSGLPLCDKGQVWGLSSFIT